MDSAATQQNLPEPVQTATPLSPNISGFPGKQPPSLASPKHGPNLQSPKLASITPKTQLTGATTLANQQSMGEETAKGKPAQEEADKGISENPAANVLSAYPMSRPTEKPPASQPPAKGLAGLPSIATAANAVDTNASSPNATAATTSATTNGSETGSATVTAGPTNNTDPALLQSQAAPSQPPFQSIQRASNVPEGFSATTPTTPGFVPTPTTPFSPSTPGGSRGRHTCPHCNQTFTRHHNLKSHLLTHSHEKPFPCPTCQARFRRLHDLKRHAKLHTGERPHVCTKCGRKFARGDALARHARAEGGCAGRRGSISASMMPDILDDENEDTMEGLEGLMGDTDGDVEMTGTAGSDGGGTRRRSLPSIRTDFTSVSQGHNSAPGNPITPASGATSGYAHTPTPHHANTYPPLSTPNRTASTSGPSPGAASLFPPPPLTVKPPNSASSPMQVSASVPTPASTTTATASILSPHTGVTDSPRDASPPASGARERNTSFPFNATSAPTANMGAVPANNVFSAGIEGLWSYMKGLEERVKSLEAEVAGLKKERDQPQQKQEREAPSVAAPS